MITGKRGQEQLLSVIIQLIIVTLFLILVVYFINSAMSGRLAKDQMASKQVALLLDSAKPGTTIAVSLESLTLEADKVKSESSDTKTSYDYEFYNPNVNIEKREAGSYVLTVK
jgi:hypothetical protein